MLGNFAILLLAATVFWAAIYWGVEAVNNHLRTFANSKHQRFKEIILGLMVAMVAVGFFVFAIAVLAVRFSGGETMIALLAFFLLGGAYLGLMHYQKTKAHWWLHAGAVTGLGLAGILLLGLIIY